MSYFKHQVTKGKTTNYKPKGKYSENHSFFKICNLGCFYEGGAVCLDCDFETCNFDCIPKAELFGGIGVAGDKVADRQYDVVLEVTSSWSLVMVILVMMKIAPLMIISR